MKGNVFRVGGIGWCGLLLFLLWVVPSYAQSDSTTKKDVPNIFTPNGDGVNDYLVLESTQGKELTFMVFNRTGSLVYKCMAHRIEWDGCTEHGRKLADGVYYYVLIDPGEEYESNRGFIYISRQDMRK